MRDDDCTTCSSGQQQHSNSNTAATTTTTFAAAAGLASLTLTDAVGATGGRQTDKQTDIHGLPLKDVPWPGLLLLLLLLLQLLLLMLLLLRLLLALSWLLLPLSWQCPSEAKMLQGCSFRFLFCCLLMQPHKHSTILPHHTLLTFLPHSPPSPLPCHAARILTKSFP